MQKEAEMKRNEGWGILLTVLVAVFASAPVSAENRGDVERDRQPRAWPLEMVSGQASRLLLVREGATVPPRALAAIEDVGKELRFAIGAGSVRFGDGAAVVAEKSGTDGVVSTPALRAGRAHDESFIEITVQGRSLGVLHVRTIPVETWAMILDALSADPGAVVERTSDYAVVNEALMKSSNQGMQQRLGSAPPAQEFANAESGGMRAAGVCFRQLWGPGWVNWNIGNPAQWGYSVKPENSWPLVWARAPGQDADGIYNWYWGCNEAVKVPDNCTATVGDGQISCCCNMAGAALGHVCEWVYPADSSIGWPICPL
jgi:hypothetical protein